MMWNQLKSGLLRWLCSGWCRFCAKTEAGSGNILWNMADYGTHSDYCYSIRVLVVTAFSLTREFFTHTQCPCLLVNVMSSNTAFYTQLSLGEVFGLHVCRMAIKYRYTYDIIARKNKTAKLKFANWNWRPIRQIKFPLNFPAIRYLLFKRYRLQLLFWSEITNYKYCNTSKTHQPLSNVDGSGSADCEWLWASCLQTQVSNESMSGHYSPQIWSSVIGYRILASGIVVSCIGKGL